MKEISETAKPYTFRNLKATDLFLVLNLVKKVDLKTITEAYQGGMNKVIDVQIKKKKDSVDIDDSEYAEIGMAMFNVAQIIIERLSDCETEIFKLLEATSDLSMEQIKDLDITVFIDMIYDFVNLDGFKELFTRAVSLFNTAK